MRPRLLSSSVLTTLLLGGLLVSPASVVCAGPPAEHDKPARKKAGPAASRSANVKKGEIAAPIADGTTLTLKDSTGQTTTYSLSAKLRCFKAKRPAQPADFKAGEAAVARLRRS